MPNASETTTKMNKTPIHDETDNVSRDMREVNKLRRTVDETKYDIIKAQEHELEDNRSEKKTINERGSGTINARLVKVGMLRELASVNVINQRSLNAHLASGTTINLVTDIALTTMEYSSSGVFISGISNLVIDGKGYKINGQGAMRCFFITGDSDVVLQNLVVTNGNTEGSGGGFYINSASVTFTACIISNSTASGWGGGGLWIEYGADVTLAFCTIIDNANSGWGGGGIWITGGATVSLAFCAISNNHASGVGGGGFWIDDAAVVLSLTSCTVSNNIGSSAGGIHLGAGSLTLAGCAFLGNTANDLFVPPSPDFVVLSLCPRGQYNAGSGTLTCSGCTSSYPADLLDGVCSSCPALASFSCCGATASAQCSTVPPDSCPAASFATCPDVTTDYPSNFPTRTPTQAPSMVRSSEFYFSCFKDGGAGFPSPLTSTLLFQYCCCRRNSPFPHQCRVTLKARCWLLGLLSRSFLSLWPYAWALDQTF